MIPYAHMLTNAAQVPDAMLLTKERCLELGRLGPALAAADLPAWTVLAAFLVDIADQVCCWLLASQAAVARSRR